MQIVSAAVIAAESAGGTGSDKLAAARKSIENELKSQGVEVAESTINGAIEGPSPRSRPASHPPPRPPRMPVARLLRPKSPPVRPRAMWASLLKGVLACAGALFRLLGWNRDQQLIEQGETKEALAVTQEALHEKEHEAAIFAAPEHSIADNLDVLRALCDKQQ
jgi:hypothetical protein